MSRLIDEFRKYQDEHGLTSAYTNGTSGLPTQNGALFTIEYLLCLMADDETPQEEKIAELERIKKVLRSLEKYPGVSARKPGDEEFDSMDNAGALATFAGLFDDGGFSKRCYDHGANTRATGIDVTQDVEMSRRYIALAQALSGFQPPRFFWNVSHPDKWCFAGWHGRSPAHLAFLKMTAGRFVGPFGAFAVLVGQFIGLLTEHRNTDAKKLPYVNWQFLKTRSLFWRLSYKLWCFLLARSYPNGMIDVYDIYYSKSHPIVTFSKKFIPTP